MKNPPWPTLQQ